MKTLQILAGNALIFGIIGTALIFGIILSIYIKEISGIIGWSLALMLFFIAQLTFKESDALKGNSLVEESA